MSVSTALVCCLGIICVTCVASDWIAAWYGARRPAAPGSRDPERTDHPDPRGEGPLLGPLDDETA